MKPKLLPNPEPYYRRDYSKHPHAVRISFDDGSTVIYDRRDDQPAPVIQENIRIIRRMEVGYQYQPRRRRNRT